VFAYECVRYKPDPENLPEMSFTDCMRLVLQDHCLLYVEGCIRMASLSDGGRGHHAWVRDSARGLCYEFSQLPIATPFGEEIPSTKVEYYGCEFTRQELTSLRVPVFCADDIGFMWERLL
jgi:hypothetical protein